MDHIDKNVINIPEKINNKFDIPLTNRNLSCMSTEIMHIKEEWMRLIKNNTLN